jgi:hypothetical protein
MKIEAFSAMLVFASVTASSAQKTDGNPPKYFSKITIEPGDIFLSESDTLLTDTLIMRDAGKLVFLKDHTVVGIAHAFIGDHCKFDASGLPGNDGDQYSRDGAAGTNGRSLTISARIETLGSLVITSSGGDGGSGFAASYAGEMPPPNAVNGGNGGDGGRGGDAGDVDLFYLSPNFVVVFNEDRSHSIRFQAMGGKGGDGGKGAEGWTVRTLTPNNRYEYSKVPRGNNGMHGREGDTGKFRFLKTGT